MLDSEFNKKMEIESTRLNFVYEDIYLLVTILKSEHILIGQIWAK